MELDEILRMERQREKQEEIDVPEPVSSSGYTIVCLIVLYVIIG